MPLSDAEGVLTARDVKVVKQGNCGIADKLMLHCHVIRVKNMGDLGCAMTHVGKNVAPLAMHWSALGFKARACNHCQAACLLMLRVSFRAAADAVPPAAYRIALYCSHN